MTPLGEKYLKESALERETYPGSRDPIIVRQEDLDCLEVRGPYGYLQKQYGASGTDWRCLLQLYISRPDGKTYDQFQIELANGEVLHVDFEVSPAVQEAVQARFRQL